MKTSDEPCIRRARTSGRLDFRTSGRQDVRTQLPSSVQSGLEGGHVRCRIAGSKHVDGTFCRIPNLGRVVGGALGSSNAPLKFVLPRIPFFFLAIELRFLIHMVNFAQPSPASQCH